MTTRPTYVAVVGFAIALAVIGGDHVAAPAAAQGFVGLPPPPGSIGPVRRGADGRIEPVAPPSSAAAPRRRAAGRSAGPAAAQIAEPAEEPASDVPWTATQQPSRSIQPQFLEVEAAN